MHAGDGDRPFRPIAACTGRALVLDPRALETAGACGTTPAVKVGVGKHAHHGPGGQARCRRRASRYFRTLDRTVIEV